MSEDNDSRLLLLVIAIGVSVIAYNLHGTAQTPQANESSCQMTMLALKESTSQAMSAQPPQNIYYMQVANMNLQTLLAKGCCQYEDTCPALTSVN